MHVATPYGEISYRDQGRGEVALFVHGVFLNGHLWRTLIDEVSDLRRCLAIDLLGHGHTTMPAGEDLSFTTQAAMIVSFLDACGIDQVDLVANDSGGGIAQIVAAHHPDRLRSLTLTNCDVHDGYPPPLFAGVRRLTERGGLGRYLRRMLDDVEFARSHGLGAGYEDPERLSEEDLQAYLAPLASTPRAINDLERFITTMDPVHNVIVEPLLRRLTVPTLIVWGTADIFFDVGWAYWLRETIPGAREVVELADARLFFPAERPSELAQLLRKHWTA
jgi:pimeloyl-ACP methyl ester carboxylesterase